MNLAEVHFAGKLLMDCATSGMQVLSGPHLSVTDLMVMESLLALGPASIGDIARRTGFVQSRISTVVADLHMRDLVNVRTDDRDRRRTLAEISDRALGDVERISTGDALTALATWFPHASDTQLQALVSSLTEILASVGTLADTDYRGR